MKNSGSIKNGREKP